MQTRKRGRESLVNLLGRARSNVSSTFSKLAFLGHKDTCKGQEIDLAYAPWYWNFPVHVLTCHLNDMFSRWSHVKSSYPQAKKLPDKESNIIDWRSWDADKERTERASNVATEPALSRVTFLLFFQSTGTLTLSQNLFSRDGAPSCPNPSSSIAICFRLHCIYARITHTENTFIMSTKWGQGLCAKKATRPSCDGIREEAAPHPAIDAIVESLRKMLTLMQVNGQHKSRRSLGSQQGNLSRWWLRENAKRGAKWDVSKKWDRKRAPCQIPSASCTMCYQTICDRSGLAYLKRALYQCTQIISSSASFERFLLHQGAGNWTTKSEVVK